MSKLKIILTVGLPASGKSTWAKQFVLNNTNWIRVNRDDFRNMCGKYWVPTREKYITNLEQFAVENAIENGFNVILDATNFNPKVRNWIDKIAKKYNSEVEEKIFNTSLEDCIIRDKSRENPVGEAVILGMFKRYLISKK